MRKLQAPVGPDKTPVTTHRFVYHCKMRKHKTRGFKELREGYTDVYDALGHLTRYTYDTSHRLTAITRYEGTTSYTPYSQENYVWNKDGNLIGKIFKDGKENIHHAHYFTYDAKGNVLTSTFCGKLTGLPAPDLILDAHQNLIENGYERECKTYTYSDLNLVLSETDTNGKTITYTYVKGTDHLKAKYITYDGQIQQREFYSYDDNYVLLRKKTDDGKNLSSKDLTGVTERHYTLIKPRQSAPFGLAETIDERYLDLATGQKKLLKSSHLHYSPEGRLLKQEITDAVHQPFLTLEWEYDLHGNLLKETDACKEVINRQYDDNDNLIFQQSSSSDFHLENSYDYANRLITQEEVHADGQRYVTSHTYDYLGNCLTTRDLYGQETRQTFDEFGRLLTKQLPQVLDENDQLVHPVLTNQYDSMGRPICVTDARGGQTTTEYNSRGQPTKITHPDGSIEQWIYRLDGQVIQKVDKNGTRTVYQRDPLGRVTEEALYTSTGEFLKKTQMIYNALHLLQTIDVEGNVITHSYDGAGRLREICQGERMQQNAYDTMGRLSEIREWFAEGTEDFRTTIKKYDVKDRVIEERMQASDGTLLHLTTYVYDARGDCILTETADQKKLTTYNSHHQPIKITNGLGHSTHTTYNHQFINPQGQRVLQSTTTDPLGYQTIHTYDSAQRLVDIQRLHPFGSKLAHQRIRYDLCGNQCHTSEEVIQEGKLKRVIDTHFTYSANQQITTLIEAAGTPEQKITRHEYTPFGQKSATIKPDGTHLFYQYDALGRLVALKSSDGSISYAYEYDVQGQVTQATDLRSNQSTKRSYDPFGQMTTETLGHGLSLHYTYDKIGRPRRIQYPDQSTLEYIYNAAHLKEIHRVMAEQRTYSQKDLQHTLAGQIKTIRLPGNNGEVNYEYNALGHCTAINGRHFNQSDARFDAAGNLLAYQSQGIPYTFAYDDYYHLKTENGHTSHAYQLDSLSNRVKKDEQEHSHNGLNQIVYKGSEQFIYDPNGNLIRRLTNERTIAYSYDALDRLVQIDQQGKKTTYVYDAFNRRLSKKSEEEEEQWYVYQCQEEIGRWGQGSFQEFRILGSSKRSPLVAIELKQIPYVPLSDFSGNVTCLLDHEGNVLERYRYTAFGESEILSPNEERLNKSSLANPWQYASKRLDEESGLIAFGLRYYEPEIGRWITPDPLGFEDGTNLYAYVQHSPLLYFDQFGLYKNDEAPGIFGLGSVNFSPNFGWHGGWFQNLYQNPAEPSEIKITHIDIEEELSANPDFRKYKERTAIYNSNDLKNPETGLPFQFKEESHIGIGFINGIQNNYAFFSKNLIYLSEISGYNVQGVHCATWGFIKDAECYYRALRHGEAYEGVRKLHTVWYDFFKKCPQEATFLQFAHSRGVVYTRNALLTFPEELRQRIEVIAVAPGCYIDPYLCKGIQHYESEADVVPLLDAAGRIRCRNTIATLKRHPDANYFDHDFMSPTFHRILNKKMDDYIERSKQ